MVKEILKTATDGEHQAGSSSTSTFSFLLHSRSSLGDDSPPLKQESSLQAKAKRKRTSAHDQAILEAAYQKNSKPDKAERADIVNRIQLGEKEVQIWFQNRRQNDRRRSKPLDAHELLAHMRNNPPSNSRPILLDTQSQESPLLLASSVPTQHGHPSPPSPSSPSTKRVQPSIETKTSDLQDILNPIVVYETVTSEIVQPSSSMSVQKTLTPPSSLQIPARLSPEPSTPPSPISKNPSNSSGKKRDHAQMLDPESPIEAEPISKPVFAVVDDHPLLRRSSSVRLAVTADGAVKIRTNNEPTPSPPKRRALPPVSSNQTKSALVRSKSALDSVDVFKDIRSDRSKQIGAGFGRSRDVRTWEFYCDGIGQDALTKQVEAERNGSAVGAINLIRSNSSKSRLHAMTPASNRNSNRSVPTTKRSGKPKLARTQSSLARLQSSTTDKVVQKSKLNDTCHIRSPSGDSDKENWAPGTRASDNPLRRTQESHSQRPVLRENHGVIYPEPSAASSQRSRQGNGGKPTNGQRAGGVDLDCIQGLLSLSQGAWK